MIRFDRPSPWNLHRLALLALALPALLPASLAADQGDAADKVRRDRAEVVVRTPGGGEGWAMAGLLGRGYLGVEVSALSPELRRHFGATEEAGVLIARVAEESPAAAAGLEVGDVVTAIDGEPVSTGFQLGQQIRRLEKGDTVALDLVRDQRPMTVTVEIAERERVPFDVGRLLEWGEECEEGAEADEDCYRIRRPIVLPRIKLPLQHLDQLGRPFGEGPWKIDPNLDTEALNERLQEMNDYFAGIDWQGLTYSLNAIDWEALGERTQQDVKERLEELEERLRELEKQLDDGK